MQSSGTTARKTVKVLERRPVVGGAAITEEFHPGFRNSVYSYGVSLLHPDVISDLELGRHGLEILERPADYRMPVRGLYLCGSGAHPGGGVSGLPGRNCAHEIVRKIRGRSL